MKQWDRKAKMDEMETLEYEGWHFLCGGEQLPSGAFQAAVRRPATTFGPSFSTLRNSTRRERPSNAQRCLR